MILDQLFAYIQSFADGKTSYGEFDSQMSLVRDVVEEANAILDGTCAGLVNEDQIRQWIAQAVEPYKHITIPT